MTLNVDEKSLKDGVLALVVTLVEVIQEALESQALRRIEGGTLDDAQVERLGVAFMRLEERMEELKEEFGLTDEDLNLNLGPLGDLR